jgi:ATP-dependent RNA helicase RhlE
MGASFEDLGLSSRAREAVRRAGFGEPTPIQAKAIPPALAGQDVVGCAATGTGKTAAYLLPMIDRLEGERETVALILAPTRELVHQIAGQVRLFGEARGVRHLAVVGGEDMAAQTRALEARPNFVVATPGRLVDLLGAGAVKLETVRVLVLDEADRMLDMGFRPQLEQVLRALPGTRQTLLFSATLGGEVYAFARGVMRQPVRVEATPSGTPAQKAEQRLYFVKLEEKYPLLQTLLASVPGSTLLFVRTRARADKVLEFLARQGERAAALHADRTQNQRREALEGFQRGQFRCLVATDIAARGLDLEGVAHVINFDLPHAPEDYVHRIGRTARATAVGLASTLATGQESREVVAMERVMGQRIPRAPVPHDSPVFQEALAAFLARQRDPGPPQPGHGEGKRAQGRHARIHPKKRG